MSAEPAGSRGERRKARTIAAILEAAEHEILEHGYHRARIEDISQRADVAVGSIYAHFDSKLGLYLAVFDRALTVEEEYLAGVGDERHPPGERLVATGQRYARFALDYPGYFRLLASPPAVERGGADLPPAVRGCSNAPPACSRRWRQRWLPVSKRDSCGRSIRTARPRSCGVPGRVSSHCTCVRIRWD